MSSYMRRHPILCVLTFSICLWLSPSFVHAQEADSLKEKKTREGFLIDLKSLISRSKEKIEEANEKIGEQEKYERNQKREEKAREYFEKGKRLYDDGKYDKAAEFFERAIKITEHPEMKGYVRHSSAKTKKEQKALSEAEDRRLKQLEQERGFKAREVEKTYAKAVSLFKREKYVEARNSFQEVDKMFPDHKATRSYLMLINQRIQDDQEDRIAQQLETTSESYEEGKNGWKNELERKAKARREQLEKQAEKIYLQAMDYYKKEQLVLAKEKFKEVEWILPNYKSTVKYLKKLDKEIKEDEVLSAEDRQRLFEKQLREERAAGQAPEPEVFEELKEKTDKKEVQKRLKDEADFVYRSAVSLYKKKSYPQAKDMFMEVERIYPGYQKTRKYLSAIEKKIPQHQRSLVKLDEEKAEADSDIADEKIKKQVIQRREQFAEEAEKKYKEALEFYRRQNFVEAKIKFIQVEALYADYKDTRQYLAGIDSEISGQLQRGDDKAIRGLEVAWQDSREAAPVPAPSRQEVKRPQPSRVEDAPAPPKRPLDRDYSANFEAEAKVKYKEAVQLYKKKNFIDARKKFVEVNELVPGYKRTKGYIAKLNKLVPSIYYDEDKADIKPLVQETVKAAPEPVRPAVSEREKEAAVETESEKTPVTASRGDDKLASDYQRAIRLYNDKNYADARELFNRINERSPEYKMTTAYLDRIERRLARGEAPQPTPAAVEATSETPSEVADARERREDRRLTSKAEGKSQKSFVRSFNEEQKELADQKRRFSEQEKVIAKLTQEQRREEAELYERQIGGLYEEAIRLYKAKNYDEARMKFSAVNAMNPDYKSAQHYLNKIDQMKIIDEEKGKIEQEIKEIKVATQQAETKLKEIKSKPEVARAAAGGESGQLVATMAKEWKDAEAEVERLRDALREKEMALKWRTEEETRIAEIMALEEETERLEQMKYDMHRDQLEAMYEEEEKALEASNERIEKRVNDLTNKHKQEAGIRDEAAREAREDVEAEKRELKKRTDRIADAAQKMPAATESEAAEEGISEAKETTAGKDVKEIKSKPEPRALQEASAGARQPAREAKLTPERVPAAEQKSGTVPALTGELAELQENIRRQEEQLARERQAAEERLAQEKQRVEQATQERRERIMKTAMAAPAKGQPLSFEERYRLYSEQENEEALEALIRARQKELRYERERIREEFQESLEELYNKAVDLYHAGYFDESQRMFREINIMAPSYKKTDNYLAKFEEAARQTPKKVVNQYGQQIPKIESRPSSREQMISNILDEAETTF